MKDHELEAYLLAARQTDGAYSPFTQSVLQAIQNAAHGMDYEQPSWWQAILAYAQRSMLRKAVALAVLLLVTAFIGLSGYAYAHDINPFTLIKRWVVGEQVQVTYQDPQTNKQREFSYGTKRTYSDVAVSAYAEVTLIDQLHFHATHAYTVPKDGIEYISDPFRNDYIYPRVGTVEEVNDKYVVLHLTYYTGLSKVEPSRDIDERITVPRAYFYYYKDAKLVAIQPDAVGSLVYAYQDHYLQHKQHSGQRPAPVDIYSVFAVTHSYEAIKEATQTKGPAKAYDEEGLKELLSQQDIHERGAGAWAQTCLGNGADACPHAFRNDDGQNFFDSRITPGEYGGQSRQNPNMIRFGEAVLTPTPETRQYQLRHIEGRITKIAGDRITIKTPSGALWTFQYAVANQQDFAKLYGRPLKVGQLLAGGVIASVYDWDRRDYDDQYVFGMSRYQ